MSETQRCRLYGVPGWGSVLVEAALVRSRLPYTIEDVTGFDSDGERLPPSIAGTCRRRSRCAVPHPAGLFMKTN